MGACCSTRDPNDSLLGIEMRNDKSFYFNYPKLLEDLDKKLKDCLNSSHVAEDDDVTHFKWVERQLLLEIN